MILVTASTGKIGSLIVSEFAARGVPSRALIRDRSHARDLPGIEWVVGDYEDDASMDGALDGVTMMYLACGESGRKVALEKRAIDAAVRSTVGHVIKVSASDAHDDNASGFRRGNGMIERYLRDSGLAWTILRPTMFNQSLDPLSIVAKGEILSPQGEATTPFIDVRDIADVAVAIMLGENHHDRIYDLTGPDALTQRDFAELLTDVFGKPIACRHVTDAEAYRGMIEAGLDEGMARSMIAHWQSYRTRPSSFVSGWIEILTGHRSRTLRAYLEECAAG
jgi:uncharacterized protein YbjT (DUF2867 family)